MDLAEEEIAYIFRHYTGLMTHAEAGANRNFMLQFKLRHSDNSSYRDSVNEKFGVNTAEAKELMKDGFEAFKRNFVERVLREHKRKITFNRCPVCGSLARTPVAKQCRCGAAWH